MFYLVEDSYSKGFAVVDAGGVNAAKTKALHAEALKEADRDDLVVEKVLGPYYLCQIDGTPALGSISDCLFATAVNAKTCKDLLFDGGQTNAQTWVVKDILAKPF